MKKCLNCNSDFEAKSKKSIFCSSKCRLYSFRDKKRIKTDQWKYIQDSEGNNYTLDKSLVLKLAIFFGLDVRMPKKNKLAEIKPKIDSPKEPKPVVVKKAETIAKPIVKQVESFESPIKKKVDYAKELDECQFPEDFKRLWDKISEDDSVSLSDKKLWKITLNIR